MTNVIPFDFEEQAVRVILRDGEPWFVAADVCRVLDIANARDAVSRLDDDEKGVASADTLGGAQRMTIISESGLYALVLTSRKDAARRFRKWITAEVLPSLRRTGRYDMGTADTAPPDDTDAGQIAGLPLRQAELWLQMVREARLTRGTGAALSIWARSPLPQIDVPRGRALADPEQGRQALAHVRATLGDIIAAAQGGDMGAQGTLARHGLRWQWGPDGLFLANGPLALFDGTAWAAGLHRAALLALPGAQIAGPLTLAGQAARGVWIPAALVTGGQDA